jgi:Secretion system C-terminal sorting domain/SprB repeat
MKRFNSVYVIFTVIIMSVIFLGNTYNPSNPPNGNTSSPGDGSDCGNCHGGGTYGGNVAITGVPATIMPSTVYPITVTITKTSGTPVVGGFSLKSENNFNNIGTFAAGTGTSLSQGYVRQSSAKTFGAATNVSWTFNWTSPAAAALANGTTVSFYTSAIMGNNNGSTGGDAVVNGVASGVFQAAVTPLTVTTTSTTNVTCNGGSNGSATVSASGGSGCTNNFTWSNGATGATANNLIAGTYTVTATCGAQTGTKSVTITQPTAIAFSSTSSQNVNCLGVGSVTALASGGTGTLNYIWSNGKTGSTVSVNAAGTYTVTATDGSSCTKTTTVSVGSNTTPPTAQIQASGALSCVSNSVTLSNTTSSANYTYTWAAQGGSPTITNTYNVTQAGTYNLTVTDITSGCTATSVTSIGQNTTPPNVQITNINPTITCSNPTVVLNANSSSGVGILSFAWSGSGITSGGTTALATVNQGGNFTVTVTDSNNGCSGTKSIGVLANTALPVVTATGGTTTCAQPSVTLNASVNPTGGALEWFGPANFTSTNAAPTATAAGTYTVTATAANGCKGTATTTITENKTAPSATIQGSNTICAGATATISTAAGSASYLWSNAKTTSNISITTPGTYSVTVTGANGCSANASLVVTQAPQPIVTVKNDTLTCSKSSITLNATTSSNLATTAWTGPNNFTATTLTPAATSAGTYTLTATTNLGCSAQFSATIFQDKNAPTVTISGAPTICQGTVAILTATPNLGTYLWSNGKTTNEIFTNVPGDYNVTVTNAQGCKGSATVKVKVSALPSITVADLKACEGTDVIFKAVSKNPDSLTYAWTGIGNYTATTQNATVKSVTPNNNGNYYVVATNKDGCVGKDTATLSVSPKLSVTLTSKVACDSTATVTAAVTGGIAAYSYTWAGSNVVSNPLFIKAPASVAVSVTDTYGCKANSTTLSLVAPTPMVLSTVIKKQSSDVPNSGAIDLTVKGGVAPYQYTWSDGSNKEDLVSVKAGKYCVTVTDANGCKKSECFEIAISTIGTEDNVLAQSISVFPNPVTEILTIKTSVSLTSIQLFDDKGRLVKTFSPSATQLDLSQLPSAVYFLRLQAENDFAMKRVLKTK